MGEIKFMTEFKINEIEDELYSNGFKIKYDKWNKLDVWHWVDTNNCEVGEDFSSEEEAILDAWQKYLRDIGKSI